MKKCDFAPKKTDTAFPATKVEDFAILILILFSTYQEENKESDESTFDRLRDLQILLKKESAMKELCKILFK